MESGRRWKCCDKKRWQVTLRDCTTLTWQDSKYCANCYKTISNFSNAKKLKEELEFGGQRDYDPGKITVVEALNTIFDIYRNSYRTKIILDDGYMLCRNCWMLLKKLYSLFAKFCDTSSSPSFLHDFVGNKTKRVDEDVLSDEDVKQETEDEYLEEIPQFEESFWNGLMDLDEPESVLGLSLPESLTERQATHGHLAGATENSILETSGSNELSDYIILKESEVGEPECEDTENISKYEERIIFLNTLGDADDADKQKGKVINSGLLSQDKWHSRKQIAKIINTTSVKKESPNRKKHVCTYPNCGKAFDRPARLKLHRIIHEPQYTGKTKLTRSDFKKYYGEHPSFCGKPFALQQENSQAIMDKMTESENEVVVQNDGVYGMKANLGVPQTKENLSKGQAATYLGHVTDERLRTRDGKKIICAHPDCGRSFINRSNLREHEIMHELKPYVCKLCYRAYSDNESLSRHMQSTCGVKKLPNKWQSRIQMAKIIKKASVKRESRNRKKHVCRYPNCGKAFDRPSRLKVHKIIHEPQYYGKTKLHRGEYIKYYEEHPSFCGKPFALQQENSQAAIVESTKSENEVVFHNELVHGMEANLGVPGTEENLRKGQAATFLKHETGERSRTRDGKKIVCGHPDCGRSFLSRSNLREHEIMHEFKPYVCKFCYRAYSDNESLSHHIQNTCRVKKPSITEQLSRSGDPEHDGITSDSGIQAEVMKIKSNVHKKFACVHPKCGKFFDRSSQLKVHEKNHNKTNESLRGDFQPTDVKISELENKRLGSEVKRSSQVLTEAESYETVDVNVKKRRRKLVAKIIKKASVNTKTPRKKNHVCAYPNCGKAFDRPAVLILHKTTHETQDSGSCQQENSQALMGKSTGSTNGIVVQHEGVANLGAPETDENLGRQAATYWEQETSESSQTLNKKKFFCGYPGCVRSYRQLSRLRVHEVVHGYKPYMCKFCYRNFANNEWLSRHIKRKCRGKEQPARSKYLETVALRRYACYCGELFTGPNLLRKHTVVHEINAATVTCSICCAGFDTQGRLDEHLKSHEPTSGPTDIIIIHKYASKIRETIANGGTFNPKKYIFDPQVECHVCGKKLRKSNLKKHLVTHQTDRPVVCEICGSTSKNERDLKTHQRLVHSNERSYLCKVCGKSFKTSCVLKNHEAIHSDDRPFKCDVCDKQFKRKSQLRRHLILHKGLKFKCEQCGTDFTRKSNLLTHWKKSCTGKIQPIGSKKGRKPTLKVIDPVVAKFLSPDSYLS